MAVEQDVDLKKNVNPIRSVGIDAVLYIPYRLLPVLVGFFSLIIYTNALPPDEYGNYSLIMASIDFLGIFTFAWVNESVLRFFSHYRSEGRLKSIYTNSYFISLGATAAISLAIVLLSFTPLMPSVLADYRFPIVAVLIVYSLFELSLGILRSDRRPGEVSLYRSVSTIAIFLISVFLMFIFHLGLISILLGYIIADLLVYVTMAVRGGFKSFIDPRSISKETIGEFVSYGLPLVLTLVLTQLLYISDRYILLFLKGDYAVGIYSASYQLGDYPISLFSSMINMAAYPIIVSTWEHMGEDMTKRLLSSIVRYFLLFAIPIIVGVAVISQYLIIILGARYAQGAGILPLICMCELFWGLCFYTNSGLQLMKKTRVLAYLIGVVVACNIALNFLLVPEYGIVGSAVALVLSYVVYLALSLLVSRKYLRWSPPVRSIRNVAIGSAVMGVLVYLCTLRLEVSLASLFILVAVGGLAYAVVMLALGEFKDELTTLKNRYKGSGQN